MATKKNPKVSTARGAVSKFKAALERWLETRTEFISTEEDVQGGTFAELWHDEMGRFPMRQARALARACELLAEHGMHAGLDVQPTLRVSVDLRNCNYPTDQVLAGAKVLAAALKLKNSAHARRTRPSTETVSFEEALAGVPELNLPKTPKTTLRRWHKDPEAARALGVDHAAKASLQRYRVDSLIALHERKKENRSRPPQTRRDGSEDSGGFKRS